MLTSLIVAALLAASPVSVKPAQGRSKTMHVGKGGHVKAPHAVRHSRRH